MCIVRSVFTLALGLSLVGINSMAKYEGSIFFTLPGGLDGHIKIVPENEEKITTLILDCEKYLISKGCKPKAVKKGGSGGGNPNFKPAKTVGDIPDVCPDCGSPLKLNYWAKGDKTFFTCSKAESHYKESVKGDCTK
jgi:hypothetical protein